MRKNKTWEITLTNNSRLVANEPIDNAVVYTTDTEAYLNFRVIDSGFEFDSATIAMLNKDDGSIFERPMVKEDNTAIYKIESDVIEHFGLCQTQVLFKKGEEIFTSMPVTFSIERYMMADRPPRVEDVVSWKDLYENATETIQELNRINDELNNAKQTVEQAETQRATAESNRVSAEEQRKLDHESRSVEFAGKADKVVLKNELVNPTFSNGLEGWRQSVDHEAVVSENEVTITTNYTGRLGLYQSYNQDGLKYISAEFYSEDESNVFTLGSTGVVTTIPIGVWTRVSSVNSDTGLIRFYADSGPDNHYKIRKPIIINLTQAFGEGNEPTKEDMDELIKVTGYIDGEYALNNKEMLIWTLALIRRNTNAIVALGGA